MNSDFSFEIQGPASEVEQLIARARRCLTAQEAAGLDRHLGLVRARVAAAGAERSALFGMNAASDGTTGITAVYA